MSDEAFAIFIERERDRLHAEREAVLTQQRALETKLDGLNREMQAVDAYEAAKSGKTLASRPASPAKPVRRGSRRDALLSMIRKYPNGLKRREILEKLGFRGNQKNEMSISNALTALTRGNQLIRREGRYHAT